MAVAEELIYIKCTDGVVTDTGDQLLDEKTVLVHIFAVKYKWNNRKKKRNIAVNNQRWLSEAKENFQILRAQQLLYRVL